MGEKNMPETILTTDKTDTSPSRSVQEPSSVSFVSCQLENDAENFHLGDQEPEEESEKALSLTTDKTAKSPYETVTPESEKLTLISVLTTDKTAKSLNGLEEETQEWTA